MLRKWRAALVKTHAEGYFSLYSDSSDLGSGL